MKTIISTRLNAFKSRPELYQWKYSLGDPRDLFDRMCLVKGSRWYSINYPEHFPKDREGQIKKHLKKSDMRLSSVNLRYPGEFALGAFTNPEKDLQKKAYYLTCSAVDLCRELGGSDVVLWLGSDGFDYSFQMNYPKAWAQELYWIGKTADYAAEKDIRISIEYKPFEPRKNSLMGDFGLTLSAVQKLGRKNLGITCDVCHMLMANEYPASLIAIALEQKCLFGLHLNDGYGKGDDGLAVGMVNLLQHLEIFKYLQDYDFQGFLYCDTFPVNEDPVKEYQMNTERILWLERTARRIATKQLEDLMEKQEGLLASRYVWDTILEGGHECV